MAEEEKKVTLKKQWFIDSKKGNIKEEFYFEKKLGSGGYGTVYQARRKVTGQLVAIKAIQKQEVKDYENFLNEITILKKLDHPNIVRLQETWETDRICFLVTELCEGGELFYVIKSRKYLKESEAAMIMRQAFSAIKYCHDNNICHRDLKPENFLLQKNGDLNSIKLIDFGLSQELTENELMTKPNGTPFYIAPEVLKGDYGKECDNWSLGVILYILICGRPPFHGKNNVEILKRVAAGEINFDHAPFKTASDDVKDLISKLMTKDLKKRFTAQDAFQHKWVQHHSAKDDIEGHDISEFFQEFIESQALRRTALTFIASRINESDIQDLKNSFIKFDKNGDGRVSNEELIAGLKTLKNDKIKEINFEKIMNQLDSNKNGFVDYTEFIAGCLHTSSMLKEKHLLNAFRYFDKDKNEKITKEELRDCLCQEDLTMDDKKIEDMIKEVDIDGDGAINYEEFLKMMVGQDKILEMAA